MINLLLPAKDLVKHLCSSFSEDTCDDSKIDRKVRRGKMVQTVVCSGQSKQTQDDNFPALSRVFREVL